MVGDNIGMTQIECILVLRIHFSNNRLSEILNAYQVKWLQEILILKVDPYMLVSNIFKKYIFLRRLNWRANWGQCIEVARKLSNIVWLFPLTCRLQNPRGRFGFHFLNWNRIKLIEFKTKELFSWRNQKNPTLTVHIHYRCNFSTVQSPGKSKSLLLAHFYLRIYLF